MDFSPKRRKLAEDHGTEDFDLLKTLCSSFSNKNIAVEFHDDNVIKKITYGEIATAKKEIEDILFTVIGSQFIAIDLEIHDFCIPALILGIIASGRGFINISLLSTQESCFRLKIKYFFTQNSISDAEIIRQINFHGENIYFCKFKSILSIDSDFDKNQFAYAITTSGTTGSPKIVKVPHDSIVSNILDLRKIFSISNEDKIAQITPFTFDPSIVEIFLGLCSNCILFMASKNLKSNPKKLLETMDIEKVTFLQTTPSLLFGQFSKKDLKNRILGEKSHLRILVLGGESFPKKEAIEKVRNEKNHTRIFNIYGITEVSCWASIEEFEGEKIVDICNGFLGQTLSHTLFQVRTEDDKILEKGEGILFIGSRKRICLIDDEEINLSNDPVFRNTGDSVIIDNSRRIFYKGRNNKVIKRFGNKIDLNKLENAVSEMKLIQNCYAIWDEKSQKLHICVSMTENFEEKDKVKSDIMNHLRSFPSIFRPDEIHLMNNFPLTVNGKICLQSLKKICIEKQNHTKISLQDVESILKNLWKLFAGSLELGFTKSGGNSITALQIVNSVSEKFDQEFPELIGMLLNDAKFSDCVKYIENQLNFESVKNSESKVKIFASSSYVAIDKRREDSINHEISPNSLLWQECRGLSSEKNAAINPILSKGDIRFEFSKSFDLKKCVDASPTVFQYSNGKVFATVGSHSGLIITVEINSHFYDNYITELPDRIEASVLVFDQFRGVVGCYDGNVYCLNLKNGEIFWKFQTGDAVKSTAATCSEKKNIFVGSYDRHMYCLSLEAGLELWKTKASEGSISGTARIHHETKSLLFGTLDGTCVNLDQVSGKIKWRHSFTSPVFSAPAILQSGNVVFAGVSGELQCFNIQTGQKLWTYEINGNIFSHLSVVKYQKQTNETIIFGSRNKSFYQLECGEKPSLKFSFTTENPIIATPWNAEKLILIACIDGTLQIINSDSGEIVTSQKLSGEIFSSPILYQDLVVVGCRDNRLYILKLVS